MHKEHNGPLRSLWLGVLLGALIITSPNWLNNPHQSNYDAPWVYPGLAPR